MAGAAAAEPTVPDALQQLRLEVRASQTCSVPLRHLDNNTTQPPPPSAVRQCMRCASPRTQTQDTSLGVLHELVS